MTTENEIFKRSQIQVEKLIKYGFKKYKNVYKFETLFMDGEFKAVIEYKDNNITGKVFDTQSEEEYFLLRTQNNLSSYAGIVKTNYEDILKDIKEKCSISQYFVLPQSNRISNLITQKYNIAADFPWPEYENYAVFRNPKNKKWFALFMNIDKYKIDKSLKGETEIVNLKIDKDKIPDLLKEKGFYPAYHMNKKNWITIILDDTLPDNEILKFIQESESYTK